MTRSPLGTYTRSFCSTTNLAIFFKHWNHRIQVKGRFTLKREQNLFKMCFCTHVHQISSQTGKTSFAVSSTASFLSFGIHCVQLVYGILKSMPLNLWKISDKILKQEQTTYKIHFFSSRKTLFTFYAAFRNSDLYTLYNGKLQFRLIKYLVFEFWWKPGVELDQGALAIVPLDENFHAALICRGSWLLLVDIIAVILLNDLSWSKTLMVDNKSNLP